MNAGAAAGSLARRARRRRAVTGAARIAALCVLGVIFVAPLYWMLATSLKTESETVSWPVQWVPLHPTVENYQAIFKLADTFFGRWTFNSLFTAVTYATVTVVLALITAYPLARMRFVGRTFWFWFILSSMMVPGIMFLIPHYLMMVKFGWVDTYHALIWPGAGGVFGIFLMRQFFLSIPHELEEAARIDGAGSLRILLRVHVPMLVAPMATLALFNFMGSWNNYVWPLFVVHGPMQTLPVAITNFASRYWTTYGKLMAGTAIASVPMLIAFLAAQPYFIRGMSLTGLKE